MDSMGRLPPLHPLAVGTGGEMKRLTTERPTKEGIYWFRGYTEHSLSGWKRQDIPLALVRVREESHCPGKLGSVAVVIDGQFIDIYPHVPSPVVWWFGEWLPFANPFPEQEADK